MINVHYSNNAKIPVNTETYGLNHDWKPMGSDTVLKSNLNYR